MHLSGHIAANALDFRVSKLLEPSRRVGGLSSQGSSFSNLKDAQGSQRSQGSGRGSRQRRKRLQGVAKPRRVTGQSSEGGSGGGEQKARYKQPLPLWHWQGSELVEGHGFFRLPVFDFFVEFF